MAEKFAYDHRGWRSRSDILASLFFVGLSLLPIGFSIWQIVSDPCTETYLFSALFISVGLFLGIFGLFPITSRASYEFSADGCLRTLSGLGFKKQDQIPLTPLVAIRVGKVSPHLTQYRVYLIGERGLVDVGPFDTRQEADAWSEEVASFFDFKLTEKPQPPANLFSEPIPPGSKIQYFSLGPEAVFILPLAESRRLSFQIQVLNGFLWVALSMLGIYKFAVLGEAQSSLEMWSLTVGLLLTAGFGGTSAFFGWRALQTPLTVKVREGGLSYGPSEGFLRTMAGKKTKEQVEAMVITCRLAANATLGSLMLKDNKNEIFLATGYPAEDVRWFGSALQHHLPSEFMHSATQAVLQQVTVNRLASEPWFVMKVKGEEAESSAFATCLANHVDLLDEALIEDEDEDEDEDDKIEDGPIWKLLSDDWDEDVEWHSPAALLEVWIQALERVKQDAELRGEVGSDLVALLSDMEVLLQKLIEAEERGEMVQLVYRLRVPEA